MKKGIHPEEYRLVVFKDSTTGDQWLVKSSASSKDTIKYEDGNEYPLVLIHVSSKSHPFFTGEERVLDVEGRVDKFQKRQQAAEEARKAQAEKAKTAKPKEKAEAKTEETPKDQILS
jgi:large subunit ribosomal protein L31